jgi:ParB family chromosome partitioning protein
MRLLDLPDETVELLQEGALSEGHGRALLLAEDHGARRSLARAAVEEGWSVRVVEARARENNAPADGAKAKTGSKAGASRSTHPDQEAATREIADALGEALGAEVRVKPVAAGGYKAEMTFATPEEALELARRVQPRTVA